MPISPESTTADVSDTDELLVQLALEFDEQLRQGRNPTVSDFALRHPHLADQIEDRLNSIQQSQAVYETVAESTFKVTTPDPRPEPTSRIEIPDLQVLGGYRLNRIVGQGSMGIVFEATQPGFTRPVAVKVLTGNDKLTSELPEIYAREAEASSRLEHPNIISVFDYGIDQGFTYLVMRFIEGAPLQYIVTMGNPKWRRKYRRREYDWAVERLTQNWCEVALVGAQAAEALHFAHGEGIIHRDIKPANLLLDKRNKLWVADFGLVKLREDDATYEPQRERMTGTARYMAPEGYDGHYDARSDVFSLGISLHELAAGRQIWEGVSSKELRRQRPELPIPSLHDADVPVPAQLCEIIHQAVARDPRDRYQTAQELKQALNRFIHNQPEFDRRQSPRVSSSAVDYSALAEAFLG